MFFRCFDKLFSALDRKAEGFLKLPDWLLISSCVQKRFILFIRSDLFSLAISVDMFKQSVAIIVRGLIFKTWKCSLLFVNWERICQVHFSMQHSVNVCLDLNTSYKNVYAFSQWSLYPSSFNYFYHRFPKLLLHAQAKGPPLVVLSYLLLKNKYLSLLNTSYLLTTPAWTPWHVSGHLW